MLVRTAVFKSANELVGWLLQQAAQRIDASYQPKPGQVRKGQETLLVQGIFGSFDLTRDYYYHAGKDQGHSPADAALGLEVSYTPALAKLICLEGADEPTYLKAERHLEQTGGISVSARQIQRVVQRVGSGAQSWQERPAQPGSCDAPIMYVCADGTGVPSSQFGPCLRQEAIRRGMASAGQVVLLIDGAQGLEHLGKHNFKDATQIVDFYHAMEHAGQVLSALIGKEHPDYKARQRRWAKRLLKDRVQVLIDDTRKECAGKPQAQTVERELGYFVRNLSRMQYGTFRAKGYFIGSGVVEAGCKTVIGGRCKQSGMFWSESGAQNILALRCINSSRRLEEFWKYRLNERAAFNDVRPLAA